ncbi:LIM domain-containing protein [Aphelenchoides avenae]|nr:LIM domain-containing protein [Aphelenchus avenae]
MAAAAPEPQVNQIFDYANEQKYTLKCFICKQELSLEDKMTVEKKTIHKECFKCGICGTDLNIGECARDPILARQGNQLYFCNEHRILPFEEKVGQIKQ